MEQNGDIRVTFSPRGDGELDEVRVTPISRPAAMPDSPSELTSDVESARADLSRAQNLSLPPDKLRMSSTETPAVA